MATQSQDTGQVTTQGIKHNVLVQWALQPPTLQVLRPIEILITSIHTVFPPKFGVQGHDYFAKWKAVGMNDVTLGPNMGNRPDNDKLKKAMKKLKFFLHPDKLPKDFSEEQKFVCDLLWHVTQDALKEHESREEDLGWVRD